MNRLLPFAIILVALSIHSRAQDSIPQIHGQLIDEITRKGIEYVNIGIRNTPVGCISIKNGYFVLELDMEKYRDSTLTISAIGYEAKGISVSGIDTESQLTVSLKPRVYKLESATIVGTKLKLKNYGSRKGGDGIIKGMLHGLEKAYFIPVKKGKIKAENLNFCLREPSDTVTFRVNFYKPNNKVPDRRINTKNLIFNQVSDEKGWIRCDLSQEHLVFESDFYIAVELLPDIGRDDVIKSHFKAKLGTKSRLFTRGYLNSWEEIKGLDILLNMDYLLLDQSDGGFIRSRKSGS